MIRLPFIALALAAALPAAGAGNAARGKDLYETVCAMCHSPDKNGVGPAHRGVFGRMAGRNPGYEYSSALAGSKIEWGEATLDQWLENPEKLVPGQRMGISVSDAHERQDLIAYLKTLAR